MRRKSPILGLLSLHRSVVCVICLILSPPILTVVGAWLVTSFFRKEVVYFASLGVLLVVFVITMIEISYILLVIILHKFSGIPVRFYLCIPVLIVYMFVL